MACTDHMLLRTDELVSAGGGYISVQPAGADDESDEVFVDAEVCATCRAVELVLHHDVAWLRAQFTRAGKPCARCSASTLDLGHCVGSQGGGSIHAPLDNRWTFGLLARVCDRRHVSLTGVAGQRVEGAPPNADLLALHPIVAACACGGSIHAVGVESHHSGPVSVGGFELLAQICARCERVQLVLGH